VIDRRFTVLGFFLSLGFSVLAFYTGGPRRPPVIVEFNNDSEVKGAPTWRTRAPRSSGHRRSGRRDGPAVMKVEVSVRDEGGVDHYRAKHAVKVSFRTDEGEIEDGRFSLHLYFEIPRAGSWGIFVKAMPDNPMEHLSLLVRDRASSRGPIEIETLADEAEASS
jgi:hypothetical protein